MDRFSSSPKDGLYAWCIWFLAALTYSYAFFHRVAPSVMVAELMSELAISGAMLGTLSALYFYPYVLLQIPLGALLETIGVRRLLSSALLLAGLGSFLFGVADSIFLAYLGRVLIGIGSSVGFLGSLALAAKWFAPSRYGFLSGLTMFIAVSGGILAQAPLALYVDAFGWRESLFILGGIGCGLAVLIAYVVRNKPASPNPDLKSHDTMPKPLSVRQILASAGRDRQVWKIAFVAATLAGPMLALAGLWGTPYLATAYDLPKHEAAFFASLLLLGWAVGAPLAGFISDRLGRRKPILLCGSAFALLSLSILIFVPNLPLFFCVLILILIGLSGGSVICCFALVRGTIAPSYAGGAIGIVNSMTVASGAILQPLIGFGLDQLWSGALKEGVPFYMASEYRLAFLFILLSSFAGLTTLFTIKET